MSIIVRQVNCQKQRIPSALAKVGKILERTPCGKLQRSSNGTELGNMAVLESPPNVSRRRPRGSGKCTVGQVLNLQPGDWVEVKSIQSIIGTLNERGKNRGLSFSPYMRLWCGRRCRVKGRIDKIIGDGTGQMRQLRNTVRLEAQPADAPTWVLARAGARAVKSPIGGRFGLTEPMDILTDGSPSTTAQAGLHNEGHSVISVKFVTKSGARFEGLIGGWSR